MIGAVSKNCIRCLVLNIFPVGILTFFLSGMAEILEERQEFQIRSYVSAVDGTVVSKATSNTLCHTANTANRAPGLRDQAFSFQLTSWPFGLNYKLFSSSKVHHR